jgi:hypothetical protein
MNNIPLYGYATLFLSIHALMDIELLPPFGTAIMFFQWPFSLFPFEGVAQRILG